MAAFVDQALAAVVARLAQRLKLAEDERVPVAAMRHDVVGDCCRRGDAVRKAHHAERMLAQLQGAGATPMRRVVPRAPGTLRDREGIGQRKRGTGDFTTLRPRNRYYGSSPDGLASIESQTSRSRFAN